MKFVANTDVGKKRKNNEDSYFAKCYSEDVSLYIVADGLGGYEGGEYASKILVDSISNYIELNLKRLPKLNEVNIKNILNVSLTMANKKIYDLEKTNEKYKGMGTTLVLLLKVKSMLFYMSVGDSRLYFVPEDFSDITQVTVDDTYVNELLKTKVISKEEALTHPQKHVLTKAVGIMQNLTVNVNMLDKKSGYIILCTDGITNMLSSEEILEILSKNKFEDLANCLIKKANINGGNDNITVVVVKL